MKARDGQFERRYWYIGGYDPIEEGVPTDFEKTLQLTNNFDDSVEKEVIFPNEGMAIQVAACWSVDPTKLEERKDLAGSLGLLGVK